MATIHITAAQSRGIADITLDASPKDVAKVFRAMQRLSWRHTAQRHSTTTVRAWQVTEAGTYLFPPIMEHTF
jgi:hypothetical protein